MIGWLIDLLVRPQRFPLWGQTCPVDDIVTGERLQRLADIEITFSTGLREQARHGRAGGDRKTLCINVNNPEQSDEGLAHKLNSAEIIYISANDIGRFVLHAMPLLTSCFTLVTHNSDENIDSSFGEVLDDPRLICWFAQNVVVRHPKLVPVPIGIANSNWRHGNLSALAAQARRRTAPREAAYLNFKTRTNPAIRTPVLENLKSRPGFVAKAHVKHSKFLNELARHRHCISPPGNGYDCHRTWECLYLGLVPVVQSANTDLFNGLPVVTFDDLSVITLAEIQERWRSMAEGPFDLRPLYLSYWAERIEEARRMTHEARAAGC